MVDKSEKVVWLARLGFAVRGLVYMLLGYLALTTARRDNVDDGAGDAFAFVAAIPGGTIVLFAAAAGLAGYALYRLSAAVFDIERRGSGFKGIAHRIGYFASAIIHFAMAWTAARMASGARKVADDRSSAVAGNVLDLPLGPTLLAVTGLALIAAALLQAKSSVTAGFMKSVSSAAPAATCWIGRAGHAARAVVFALIGWSLLRSARSESGGEVLSLGGAINDLRDMGAAFSLVAAGLVLFGLFSLILARYRVIPDPSPRRLKF